MAKSEGLSKDEHTIAEHHFKTEDGLHKLYVQEWGNLRGQSILFLHGGPGGGCNDGHKVYFDSQKHRVIFFDQRGSGKTTPKGSLEKNTTQDLIKDIELIRQKLKIKQWHVEGASWGSVLALSYAIAHPNNIKSMILLGIFLCLDRDYEWLEKGLYKNFYPEVYEKNKSISYDYENRSDQLNYLKIFLPLLGLDDRSRSLPDKEDLDLDPIKIELYYLKNRCFLPSNYILNNAAKINMPVIIIQGRYDMITPPISAYELSQALPNSTLLTTLTGHLPSDRESYSVLKAVLHQIG